MKLAPLTSFTTVTEGALEEQFCSRHFSVNSYSEYLIQNIKRNRNISCIYVYTRTRDPPPVNVKHIHCKKECKKAELPLVDVKVPSSRVPS